MWGDILKEKREKGGKGLKLCWLLQFRIFARSPRHPCLCLHNTLEQEKKKGEEPLFVFYHLCLFLCFISYLCLNVFYQPCLMVCLLSSLFIVVVLYHICLVVCFLSSLLGYWFVFYNLCLFGCGYDRKSSYDTNDVWDDNYDGEAWFLKILFLYFLQTTSVSFSPRQLSRSEHLADCSSILMGKEL